MMNGSEREVEGRKEEVGPPGREADSKRGPVRCGSGIL